MTQTAAPAASPVGGPPPDERRRTIWPRVLIAVAALLVVAMAAGKVYLVNIGRTITSNINRAPDVDLPSDEPSAPPGEARPTKEPQETGTLNYVLLGSDSRDPEGGGGRSDTIMVVHLNAKRNQAYIISFPRDMYVTIPGHGRNKINAAFVFGGVPLTVRTLEKLTGVRMDHVVVANFDGFIQLTEDLDGVTVMNKTAFSSHGHDFPVGEITIRGEQALWYVRERKKLPRGDLDRAENQRNVIKAIVAKGLSGRTISNPERFIRFIGNVANHLTVDRSLTDDEIRRTAFSLRLEVENVAGLQAPISGFGTTSDGQSIDIVDEARMAELGRALKTDTVGEYVKKYPQG
jgi:polyisoprenyl-teichoic acid--peptidoglycan teichoic acid transferase